MYAPCNGVKGMAKHIAIGSILHQATRSTLLVDLLHKAGHIQLRQANPQVGPLTSARYSLFLNEINGTVVLTDVNPDNFMQFTTDNIDINDSSLEGKDTFHATQVPGWQRGPDIYRTYWTEVVYGFYTFVWRQAYFPETGASEPKGDRLGASWRSTGPCLYDTQFKLGGFVGLVSFWCTTGCATLLGKCRRSHFVCTGQCGCTKVDANCCIKRCYSSLTLIKKEILAQYF